VNLPPFCGRKRIVLANRRKTPPRRRGSIPHRRPTTHSVSGNSSPTAFWPTGMTQLTRRVMRSIITFALDDAWFWIVDYIVRFLRRWRFQSFAGYWFRWFVARVRPTITFRIWHFKSKVGIWILGIGCVHRVRPRRLPGVCIQVRLCVWGFSSDPALGTARVVIRPLRHIYSWHAALASAAWISVSGVGFFQENMNTLSKSWR